MGDHRIMFLDAHQHRKRRARLQYKIHMAAHELIEQGIERREDAIHLRAGEFGHAHRNEHRQHVRRGQAVPFAGAVIYDRQGREIADAMLVDGIFEHLRLLSGIDDGAQTLDGRRRRGLNGVDHLRHRVPVNGIDIEADALGVRQKGGIPQGRIIGVA